MLRIRKRLVVTPRIAVGMSAFFVGMVGSIGILNALNSSSDSDETTATSSEVRKLNGEKLQVINEPVDRNKASGEESEASEATATGQNDAMQSTYDPSYAAPYTPQSTTSPGYVSSGSQPSSTPQPSSPSPSPAPSQTTSPKAPEPEPILPEPVITEPDESPLVTIPNDVSTENVLE